MPDPTTEENGRTARWRVHNAAQQARIVRAAAELYDEQGATVSLSEVGQRAGVSRSALYRQFADRHALELAVQQYVMDSLTADLGPTLTLTGTLRSTLERAARTYVAWASAHPRLHELLDSAPDDGNGLVQKAVDHVAATIHAIAVPAFVTLGATIPPEDAEAADPMVHGLIMLIYGTVRRWVHLGRRNPDPETLAKALARSGLVLINDRLDYYGIKVDPDAPVEQLLG